jgi:hypothetical protein
MFTFDSVVLPGHSEAEDIFTINPWCSSSGVMVRAEIGAAGGAPIVESLVVQALDNPTVESAMRAEAHLLHGIATARAKHEIDASKQSKPNL